MEYARLGSSGLKGIAGLLGHDELGDPASREWHLGEDAAERIVRPAVAA